MKSKTLMFDISFEAIKTVNYCRMSSRNQKDSAGTKLRKPHHRHQPQPSFLIVLLLEKLHQGALRQEFSAKSLRSSSIISLNSFPPRFMFIFFLFVLYFLFWLITYEIVNYGSLVFLLLFCLSSLLFIYFYFLGNALTAHEFCRILLRARWFAAFLIMQHLMNAYGAACQY